jgi:hypothetical protein
LVLRTLNLLLSGKAEPGEIVLCTFAEKAARELEDRLSSGAAALGYDGDLSSLKVGTIHGLCNGILLDHRHRTPLGNAYETLDDLSQLLFLFEHLGEIAGEGSYENPYLGRWKTRWSAAKGLRDHFDKITEELVDPRELFGSGKGFVRELGAAYLRYEEALFAENRVDFAHLQKLVHGLLLDEGARERIASPVRHVMVDEYQDTNYVSSCIAGAASGARGPWSPPCSSRSGAIRTKRSRSCAGCAASERWRRPRRKSTCAASRVASAKGTTRPVGAAAGGVAGVAYDRSRPSWSATAGASSASPSATPLGRRSSSRVRAPSDPSRTSSAADPSASGQASGPTTPRWPCAWPRASWRNAPSTRPTSSGVT